jgi:exodeoxyribonuclease VII large subunit
MADGSQLDFSFQAVGQQRRVWKPRELMSELRTSVERGYGDVWVEGEISNFRPAESGHLYFTLKDEAAQIKAVMFRAQARLLRFRPEDGLHVLARGRVTVYEQRGELQLSAEYLEPRGAGALQIAFEQLKRKLEAEGLFAAERKKAIPGLPRSIGIITSPRGAAIQDILNILRRRHSGVSVLIYPAQVQGETAASEAISGIRYFNRAKNVEVVILARGGGSFEDLAVYNHEGLARSIASSAVPVISAIGHETDFTIADFAADLRAPTPSAAAELVTQSRREIEERVLSQRQRLWRAARYQLMLARQRWSELTQHAAMARIRDAISRRGQRLDEAVYRLLRATELGLAEKRRRLEQLYGRLAQFNLRQVVAGLQREIEMRRELLLRNARALMLRRNSQWQQMDAKLRELSPVKILERGYALVFDARGKLLTDPAAAPAGTEITARLARGELRAVVKKS